MHFVLTFYFYFGNGEATKVKDEHYPSQIACEQDRASLRARGYTTGDCIDLTMTLPRKQTSIDAFKQGFKKEMEKPLPEIINEGERVYESKGYKLYPWRGVY